MGLGQSELQVHLDLPVDETFAACVDAGNVCGKVLEKRSNLGSLAVRTRYGLQLVKLRIAVAHATDDQRSP